MRGKQHIEIWFDSASVVVARWWPIRKIKKRGLKSKFSCIYRHNIQHCIENRDRERANLEVTNVSYSCVLEKKKKFSSGEVMLHRIKNLGFKPMNVAEVIAQKIIWVFRHLGLISEKITIQPRDIWGPFADEDSFDL